VGAPSLGGARSPHWCGRRARGVPGTPSPIYPGVAALFGGAGL